MCIQKKLKSKELGIASVAQKVNKINKKQSRVQCLKAVWSLGKHSWTCMKSYDSKTITGHQYTHHRIAVVLFVFPLSKNVSINTKQSCTLLYIFKWHLFLLFCLISLSHWIAGHSGLFDNKCQGWYMCLNVTGATEVRTSVFPLYCTLLLSLWLHYGCCYWRNCIHIPGKGRIEQSSTTHLIRQTFPEIPSRNWLTQAKNIIREHETYRKASPVSLIYPPSILTCLDLWLSLFCKTINFMQLLPH